MRHSRWETTIYLIGLLYVVTVLFSEDRTLGLSALVALGTLGDLRTKG